MKNSIPKDGFEGLKQNFSSDAISGFLVFLLALPLSLGIAGASDFPPIYGLVSAMIGGLIVTFFVGSPLTIKGPAAGLIVIVAGAVAEFGLGAPQGSTAEEIARYGWQLALGAVVVAGVLQVIFGFLKLGGLSDFFPLPAVHGMLAAIGIIIISKQIHILVGMNPLTPEGKAMVEPIELLAEIPKTMSHIFLHFRVAIVGLLSLFVVFGWPYIPIKFLKKIPASLVVLVVAIPLTKILDIHNSMELRNSAGMLINKGYKPLLEFDKGLLDILGINVSFAGMSQVGIFIKYVVMFALVGSLEALLTVKAIDIIDPFKRKSNTNKDLVAVGIGNIIAGVLGGLPMISEVARSSANIGNGGKTRWANFFHGFFILIFLLFAVYFSDLIPKSALAAMLIGVGWKLAHPREFGSMIKIGTDQFIIFVVTIIFTLLTDLLIGIAIGILLKLIMHLYYGVPLNSLFNAHSVVKEKGIEVSGAVIFSNFIKVKSLLNKFSKTEDVYLDVRNCKLLDHSVIDSIRQLKDEFKENGGSLSVVGIEEFTNINSSKHELATKTKNK